MQSGRSQSWRGLRESAVGPNGLDVLPDLLHDHRRGWILHLARGRRHIPGTTNNFGGTSTAEYGGLLLSNYPAAGFTITQRYNNFRNVLGSNPCPA